MNIPVKQERLTLSVPEAAALIGVSTSKMYEIVRSEGFPAIRVGKRVLVNSKRLEAWLDNMTEKGWNIT